MRIFLDTNILISAALYPKGKAATAFYRAAGAPNRGIVADYVLGEMRTVFQRKFSDKLDLLESFIAIASMTLETVSTPEDSIDAEDLIDDVKDRPILRAATVANADILITGDDDLLRVADQIKRPRIMRIAEFFDI